MLDFRNALLHGSYVIPSLFLFCLLDSGRMEAGVCSHSLPAHLCGDSCQRSVAQGPGTASSLGLRRGMSVKVHGSCPAGCRAYLGE